jgi:hypothetical protein
VIGFVFWITSLHDKPDFAPATEREPKALRHGSELSPKFAMEAPGEHGGTS